MAFVRILERGRVCTFHFIPTVRRKVPGKVKMNNYSASIKVKEISQLLPPGKFSTNSMSSFVRSHRYINFSHCVFVFVLRTGGTHHSRFSYGTGLMIASPL